jgi:hypothetical protein
MTLTNITSIITVRAIKLIEKCERVLNLIARHSIQFIFSKNALKNTDYVFRIL